jgi:hypothetical protein
MGETLACQEGLKMGKEISVKKTLMLNQIVPRGDPDFSK